MQDNQCSLFPPGHQVVEILTPAIVTMPTPIILAPFPHKSGLHA
jgi:hypothetical protein